jgi:hypothetical protein
MRRYWLVAMAFLAASQVMAGTKRQTITINRSDLEFSTLKGYDVVRIKDARLTEEVGKPELPVVVVGVSIPSGAELEGVTVNSTVSQVLSGRYDVYPAQESYAIDEPAPPFARQDQKAYGSSSEYPEKLIDSNSGSMGGYRIVYLLVHPVRYIPGEGKLSFHSQIDVSIHYKDGPAPRISKTEYGKEIFRKMVGKAVINPEDIRKNEPNYVSVKGDTAEYLIITSETLAPALGELALWKTKKGLTTDIKTVNWITANNDTGRDLQENIWHCIKDHFQNHGTVWVLLAGDTTDAPARLCWWRVPGQGEDKEIPCDLYYSDLDGPWDSDDDGWWGDPWGDACPDMYPDVIVGRLSAENLSEAQVLVSKVFTYVKNPPNDYLLDMSGCVFMNWADHISNMNDIADAMPPRFAFDKCYDADGCEGIEDAMAHLNQGPHFVCWSSHANPGTLWTERSGTSNRQPLMRYHADTLKNGDQLFIFNTLACKPARFTADCVAEHLVRAPDGGAIAFIGNSYLGYNPQSDIYMDEFAVSLFPDAEDPLGIAFSSVKASHVSSAGSGRERFLQYGLILLGEPEMHLWTDTAKTFVVTHPDSAPMGPQNFAVSVTSGGSPVDSALVCCYKTGDVHERGYTNASGDITLSVNPQTLDTMWVTVTKKNHFPYEGYALSGIGVQEVAASFPRLLQNTPNPFANSTRISFATDGVSKDISNLLVYDVGGRLVRSIPIKPLATHVTWNGSDDAGKKVHSGIYFYRMKSNSWMSNSKKMLFVRP